VKRWPTLVTVSCAAVVAAAVWFAPHSTQSVLGALLFALVVLTALSQRRALLATIAALKAAHDQQIATERRYRALFDACSDSILVFSLDEAGEPGTLVEVNGAACASLGYPRSRLLGLALMDIVAPEAWRQFTDDVRTMMTGGRRVFETVELSVQGARLPVEFSMRRVEIGGRALCLAAARDIALRKEEADRLLGMVNEDKLTGLLNRRGFFDMVENVASRARLLNARVLLTYVDVDGLKVVNDTLGHRAGDALLAAAADTLRATFRQDDVVARIGGDEFVGMAILGTDERLDQQSIAARFERAVASTSTALGDEFSFSLSRGTLVADWSDLDRMEELLALCDQRMYETKRVRRPAGARKRRSNDGHLRPVARG
jgi:diguanylate cyclase (GGDEF)-like protein/PAS domain S-box-containing protein